MSETFYFTREQLEQAVYDLCTTTGSPDEEADLVAKRLVKSNLTGHPSHGVIRIPRYMEMVRAGMLNPGVKPGFLYDKGATVLVDGHRGYGQVIAEKTIQVAIERGLAHGVAAVGMTNLGHIGRLADYSVQAAEADCIGIVFTASGGASLLVAPFGAKSRRMGTNPISIAIPSEREYPIVFDMATSVFAEGKLMVMIDSGRAAPDKTVLDNEGEPTTNPADFYEGGAILPLGGEQGYKGYLLNFMVEVLAGILTGGGYVGRDSNPLFNNCSMMILIHVEQFRKLSDFKLDLEKFIDFIKTSPTREGQEVLYPGEIEFRQETRMLKTGIPLPDKTVDKIQSDLDRLGVPTQLRELGRKEPFK